MEREYRRVDNKARAMMILQRDLDIIHENYDKVLKREIPATHEECMKWMEVFQGKMDFVGTLFGEAVWRDGWKVMWISEVKE